MVERLTGHAMYAPVITALFMGVRRREFQELRWCNVDLDSADRHIRICKAIEENMAGIRFKTPKSKSGVRDVSLPDIVLEALHDHRRRQLETRFALGLGKPADDALVFPDIDGSPQSPHAFTQEWVAVAGKTGGPGDNLSCAAPHPRQPPY